MCGRYLFTEDLEELRELGRQLRETHPMAEYRIGEIFPTNPALLLVGSAGQVVPQVAVWGFPNFRDKGVLINARAETAQEKKTFRECKPPK